MTVESPKLKLSLSTYQHRLFPLLLAYRWISLAPALWVFFSAQGPATPNLGLILLLVLAAIVTFTVTMLQRSFRHLLLKDPLLLGLDTLFMAILLSLSGGSYSPYVFHALSPLLAAALFFQLSGVLLAAGTFTLFYLISLFVVWQNYPLTIELEHLFTQLAGAWLLPLLFGSVSPLLRQLRQLHETLTNTYNDLTRRDAELAATHHHLEVIHELTLFLQQCDSQSVQQRLLKAATTELGFSRAVICLVDPTHQYLEGWQAQPPPAEPPPAKAFLPLLPDKGLLTEAILKRQVQWASKDQPLAADAPLNAWLGPDNWLVLPMLWQDQAVGVLLVAVENIGPVDISEERWAVLASLIGQSAVALGTIDRTRRLTIEQERNRIARDIHDTVAQSLFGMAFTLDACVKLLPDQAEVVQQELSDLRDLADRVRHEVRQSILNIWPSELTQDQFKTDLAKYVADCSPAHVFEVEFNLDGDFDNLPAAIRRGLYRVCQEALANAARHSGVDAARIYLHVDPQEVFLSIRDKGRGFDPKPALARERNRERFGLRGMQERIQSLGGTCDILSQVGHGAQVLVRVPLNGKNGYD